MYFLSWIIVGLVAAWLTRKILKGHGYGPLMDIGMGIIGAVVAGFVMRSAGFGGRGIILTTFVAMIGAVLLTLLAGFVSGRRFSYRQL